MSTPSVTLNDDQELFVISAGRGYSCYGYDNCFQEATKLAEAIGQPDRAPAPGDRGTIAQYEAYRALLSDFAKHPASARTWFEGRTDPKVERVLEDARVSGRRVIITLGDVTTGKPWDDAPDRGTIGRSTGITKVPLLIATRRSTGGGAILCANILRVQDAATKQDLYVRHVEPVLEDEAHAPSP